MLIDHEVLALFAHKVSPPTRDEIAQLARLVLGPDIDSTTNHILSLKKRGLSLNILFIELLEPAGRHLGEKWDDDHCNFST